ncbi:hypothetical protein HYC85_003523 [Camellia sinensis]|uniref:Uncharacterized protein n=1 Tax=Camellia sinensis TaxID=4442 RepID=A0A7J7HWK0_CAMSI|nr:hypothetical protein HYC85_003523 [Camellia sinensis]
MIVADMKKLKNIVVLNEMISWIVNGIIWQCICIDHAIKKMEETLDNCRELKA